MTERSIAYRCVCYVLLVFCFTVTDAAAVARKRRKEGLTFCRYRRHNSRVPGRSVNGGRATRPSSRNGLASRRATITETQKQASSCSISLAIHTDIHICIYDIYLPIYVCISEKDK